MISSWGKEKSWASPFLLTTTVCLLETFQKIETEMNSLRSLLNTHVSRVISWCTSKHSVVKMFLIVYAWMYSFQLNFDSKSQEISEKSKIKRTDLFGLGFPLISRCHILALLPLTPPPSSGCVSEFFFSPRSKWF